MLKVNAQDPEVQRRGHILSVVILGIGLSAATLSGANLLNGQYEYNVPNAIFLISVSGLFVLNRRGYVVAACILTVTLIVAASAVFLSGEELAQTFIIMCIPVFIACFLLVPWSGFVVSAVVIFNTLIINGAKVNTMSLLTFITVTTIAYLIARSLDRVNRQNRYRAYYDSLTSLPNRALFLDLLTQALNRFNIDHI